MTIDVAVKDLLLEEINSKKLTKDSVIEFFANYKFPKEITNYVLKIYDITKDVSGEVYSIGKIVVMKIIEFIKANPNLSAGIALGAIAGALATSFIGWIPLIGNLLSAVSVGIGMFIGAVSGYRLDNIAKGKVVIDTSIFGIFGDAMGIAKKFIALFIDMVNALRG